MRDDSGEGEDHVRHSMRHGSDYVRIHPWALFVL